MDWLQRSQHRALFRTRDNYGADAVQQAVEFPGDGYDRPTRAEDLVDSDLVLSADGDATCAVNWCVITRCHAGQLPTSRNWSQCHISCPLRWCSQGTLTQTQLTWQFVAKPIFSPIVCGLVSSWKAILLKSYLKQLYDPNFRPAFNSRLV